MKPDSFQHLEQKIGYAFNNRLLLEEALTHPSFSHVSKEIVKHYERLEFLGDSLIGFLLADWLYEVFPNAPEGFLSSAKGALVKGKFLSQIAESWELGKHLRVNLKDKTQSLVENTRILGSVFEALMGAIYLDRGIDIAKTVVFKGLAEVFHKEYLTPHDIEEFLANENPKGKLQEWFQAQFPNDELEYVTLEATGPGHNRFYKVAVKIKSKNQILGLGEGSSQKAASEQAALIALKK